MTIAVANTLTSNTFNHWLDNTNKIADALSTKVLTVNSNTTVGNCALEGTFTANTFHIINSITAPNAGFDVNANVTFNSARTTIFNGAAVAANTFTINTLSKLFILGSGASNGHFLSLTNSVTGAVGFANLNVSLASLTDVNATPASNNDILRWNTVTSKWNIANSAFAETMTINDLKVNTAITSDLATTGANTFLGSTVFVRQATNRVGIGPGMSGPTVTLDVNGAINATGDIKGFSTSDKKFKKNIRNVPDALKRLKGIHGVFFDWDLEKIKGNPLIGPKNLKDAGVVAQEVQKYFPVAVITRPDGVMAVDYTKLIPLLIESIHELNGKFDAVHA